MSKQMTEERSNKKTSIPFISLLLTIAVLAVTCACVVYHYANEQSYHRKWKDYDDCGLA